MDRSRGFSEKDFYLNEFRGRTLAIALPGREIGELAPLEVDLLQLHVTVRTGDVVLVPLVKKDGASAEATLDLLRH